MTRTNANSDNRTPSCEGCQPDKHAIKASNMNTTSGGWSHELIWTNNMS